MTDKKKYIVRIDTRLCKGCEICIEFCPAKVLKLSCDLGERGVPSAEVKDGDACVGCRNCAVVCPEGAFELLVSEEE